MKFTEECVLCAEKYILVKKLPLLPDPLGPEVVVSIRVSSMGQLDLFKNHSYSIGPYANKLLRSNYTKNINISVQ